MLTVTRNSLKRHMLSCKDVAHLASDYLDKNTSNKLNWKIRLHLIACGCCRKFMGHLSITQKIAPQLIRKSKQQVDADIILQRIKDQTNTTRK